MREFNIKQYGARGDGTSICTRAIQRAFDLAEQHQGRVVIPEGRFLSGTIYVRSGTTITFLVGAVIIASRQRADFADYELVALPSYADDETTYFAYSLFYGIDLDNVKIVGPGVIDGNGVARGGPKPLAFKRCRRITIQGITISNAPNYSLSLLGCVDTKIESINIRNGFVDGITADSCRDLTIRDCHIQSANDAICLKTSLALGYRNPTANVSIDNCVLMTSRSAFKIGSESAASVKNISVNHCEILSLPSNVAGPVEGGITLQVIDGGRVENLVVSDIKMKHVCVPVFLCLGNRGRGQSNPRPGEVRDISLRGIYAIDANAAVVISGIAGAAIQNVRLAELDISLVGGVPANSITHDVPETGAAYLRPSAFGNIPAYGIFCRHVDGFTVQNVCLRLQHLDERPPIFLKNVNRMTCLNFHAFDPTGSHAALDESGRNLYSRNVSPAL